MTERWLPCPDFEGRYEVSDQGRVRSCAQLIGYNHAVTGARHYRQTKSKLIAQQVQNSGYSLVHLWAEDKRYARTVHKLVARAFLGEPPTPYPESTVNHKDGDKQNNSAENLEWLSLSANHLHAVASGLISSAVRVRDPSTGIAYASITQAARAARRSHRKVMATFHRGNADLI